MLVSPCFISIEGVDGVGKTTVAKMLEAAGSFTYYYSPAGPFRELRKEVDIRSAPLERYCFYMEATRFDSGQIQQLLDRGNSVVCDRYVLSTWAYHLAMDSRIAQIHDETNILQPDLSFLITAATSVRDQRIYDRKRVVSDRSIECNGTFLDRVAENFLSIDRLIRIDNSADGPEKAVAGILQVLATRGWR